MSIFGSKQKSAKKIFPAKNIGGQIQVSPDKSISHRALIFTSLANGNSCIKNFLNAEDTLNTLKVMRKMGVSIERKRDTSLYVRGKGRYGFSEPSGKLYFGNSGTGMRLMTGILAAQRFSSVLTGDKSLSGRPMKRIIEPLTRMGANIMAKDNQFPPMKIKPAEEIKGISYDSPIASAQVKSCILLAGLYSEKPTVVSEPYKSRDHTERMMDYFEIPVEVNKNRVKIQGGKNWPGRDITIPGDFSSAAFFITAALIFENSSLEIKNVNLNPTRKGFINILKKMGGGIEIKNERQSCNEPVGDITVKGSKLKGVSLSAKDIPGVIDEIPLISLLASQADGKTIIEGAGELRKKETDRLHAISCGLQDMGQAVTENIDSLVINGRPHSLKGARVKSHSDHRMAMMFAIAALKAKGETEIDNTECIKTSFPGFFNILDEIKKC